MTMVGAANSRSHQSLTCPICCNHNLFVLVNRSRSSISNSSEKSSSSDSVPMSGDDNPAKKQTELTPPGTRPDSTEESTLSDEEEDGEEDQEVAVNDGPAPKASDSTLSGTTVVVKEKTPKGTAVLNRIQRFLNKKKKCTPDDNEEVSSLESSASQASKGSSKHGSAVSSAAASSSGEAVIKGGVELEKAKAEMAQRGLMMDPETLKKTMVSETRKRIFPLIKFINSDAQMAKIEKSLGQIMGVNENIQQDTLSLWWEVWNRKGGGASVRKTINKVRSARNESIKKAFLGE